LAKLKLELKLKNKSKRKSHCSWYNIGGAVLGAGRWNGGYMRNFPLLPFGVPSVPMDPITTNKVAHLPHILSAGLITCIQNYLPLTFTFWKLQHA